MCIRDSNYLVPGGVFIFDINTRLRFEDSYGELAYVFPGTTDDGCEKMCIRDRGCRAKARQPFFVSRCRAEGAVPPT